MPEFLIKTWIIRAEWNPLHNKLYWRQTKTTEYFLNTNRSPAHNSISFRKIENKKQAKCAHTLRSCVGQHKAYRYVSNHKQNEHEYVIIYSLFKQNLVTNIWNPPRKRMIKTPNRRPYEMSKRAQNKISPELTTHRLFISTNTTSVDVGRHAHYIHDRRLRLCIERHATTRIRYMNWYNVVHINICLEIFRINIFSCFNLLIW